MRRLLVHATSYSRLRREIDAVPGVEPVVLDEDERLRMAGGETSPEDAAVDAGWANADGARPCRRPTWSSSPCR